MRKIIYTRPDGGLSIVHPVRNTIPGAENLSDEEIERRAFDRLPDDAINPQFVDESAIPTDRTFRDAWAHGGTKVDVDMTKAVEIQQDKLRALRAPLLAGLDVDFMRAIESGDTKSQSEIASKKRALRDVTNDPALAAAQTPDELRAVIPEILQ